MDRWHTVCAEGPHHLEVCEGVVATVELPAWSVFYHRRIARETIAIVAPVGGRWEGRVVWRQREVKQSSGDTSAEAKEALEESLVDLGISEASELSWVEFADGTTRLALGPHLVAEIGLPMVGGEGRRFRIVWCEPHRLVLWSTAVSEFSTVSDFTKPAREVREWLDEVAERVEQAEEFSDTWGVPGGPLLSAHATGGLLVLSAVWYMRHQVNAAFFSVRDGRLSLVATRDP